MATQLERLRLPGSNQGSNDANPVSYRDGAITSRTISGTTYQVCCFWSGQKLAIGWRTLPFGRWTLYHYNGTDQTDLGTVANDLHNTVVCEIDADGYVHVAFNHHNDPLNYRRSDNPLGTWTGGVTAALDMLDSNETSITYPMFFRSPTGTLYWFHRSGSSGTGDLYFYEYDEGTETWSAAAGTGTDGLLIQGNTGSPTYNPYWDGPPSFSSDWDGAGTGFMHVCWMWRRSTGATTNQDPSHTRWNGSTFSDIGGSSQTVPITKANASVIASIAEGSGLLNQCHHDLDANNRPHLAVIMDDGSDVSQLWDFYHNGSSWQQQQITSLGAGVFEGDWGRPMLACDRSANVTYIWYSNVNDTDGIQQYASDPGDFTEWTKSTFYDYDVNRFEPTIDRHVWAESGETAMLVTERNSSTTHTIRVLSRRPKGKAGSTFPADWSDGRKQPITIPDSQVGSGGVSDYTVLLTRDCFDDELFDPSGSNAANADGGDLRFSSDSAGTTRLPCHVVKWGLDSSTGAGDADVEVYVKVSSLSSAADNTIYVWYKTGETEWQPFVDESFGQDAARDSVVGFWSFSRSQDNHLNANHQCLNQGAPAFAAGKVDQAFDGNGSAGVNCGNGLTLGIANAFSMFVWVNLDATLADRNQFICGESNTGGDRCFQFCFDESVNRVRLVRFNSSGSVVASVVGTSDLRNAGWKRVAATFDDSVGSAIFVDGSSENTNATTTANNDGVELRLGFTSRSTTNFIEGLLDNAEIHTARRDQAWITTDFNNQNAPGTFAVAGTPEAAGGGEAVDMPQRINQNFTATGSYAAAQIQV